MAKYKKTLTIKNHQDLNYIQRIKNLLKRYSLNSCHWSYSGLKNILRIKKDKHKNAIAIIADKSKQILLLMMAIIKNTKFGKPHLWACFINHVLLIVSTKTFFAYNYP